MNDINKYVKTHEQRFLNELFELIRIPSISSLPEHKDDMYRAAEKWKELLLAAGVDRAEVMETDGNPVTYGEKIIDKNAPTVLVYGHMDVMPVDPLELWDNDPFEPVIKDGKIWARGRTMTRDKRSCTPKRSSISYSRAS
jgi:acetylornithine deacetylase/succinyl-diaminopimelate desuccinylase-like protein